MLPTVAIIGGTGFETALQAQFGDPERIDTVQSEFGAAIVSLYSLRDLRIAFLARHGASHSIAPHNINHRANISAIKQIGARSILSTAAVGSLRLTMRPGDIIVPDDFIDLRGGPPTTFYDTQGVVHTDFSEPFSPRLRRNLLSAAEDQAEKSSVSASIIHPAGIYICVDGPRYETAAEVRCFAALGADIVGMTVAPEAILAREAGVEYASISVATNYGTGLSNAPLSHEEVEQIMAERRPLLTATLIAAALSES